MGGLPWFPMSASYNGGHAKCTRLFSLFTMIALTSMVAQDKKAPTKLVFTRQERQRHLRSHRARQAREERVQIAIRRSGRDVKALQLKAACTRPPRPQTSCGSATTQAEQLRAGQLRLSVTKAVEKKGDSRPEGGAAGANAYRMLRGGISRCGALSVRPGAATALFLCGIPASGHTRPK
jgi:hypothetical protein